MSQRRNNVPEIGACADEQGLRSALTLQLPAELVDAIAERAADLVLERQAQIVTARDNSPRWLYGAKAAADYLDWSEGRVQKLTAAKVMPHHRIDGEQRVSYRTDELDAWLADFYEGPPRLRAVNP